MRLHVNHKWDISCIIFSYFFLLLCFCLIWNQHVPEATTEPTARTSVVPDVRMGRVIHTLVIAPAKTRTGSRRCVKVKRMTKLADRFSFLHSWGPSFVLLLPFLISNFFYRARPIFGILLRFLNMSLVLALPLSLSSIHSSVLSSDSGIIIVEVYFPELKKKKIPVLRWS